MDKVCIVIPAYNEDRSIGLVVKELRKYFKHVIVVNDASSDNTLKEAKGNGAIVVDNPINKGYDGALEEGFRKAKELNKKYVITVDADGQHSPEDAKKFANIHLEDNKDLVIGIRPGFARFSEYIFSLYSRLRFKIVDPLCGMKGYDLSFYNRQGHFDSYKSIGTELAFYSVKQKCSLSQVPIKINKRQYGNPSFSGCVLANMKILKTMFKSIYKI